MKRFAIILVLAVFIIHSCSGQQTNNENNNPAEPSAKVQLVAENTKGYGIMKALPGSGTIKATSLQSSISMPTGAAHAVLPLLYSMKFLKNMQGIFMSIRLTPKKKKNLPQYSESAAFPHFCTFLPKENQP